MADGVTVVGEIFVRAMAQTQQLLQVNIAPVKALVVCKVELIPGTGFEVVLRYGTFCNNRSITWSLVMPWASASKDNISR